jgi:hypothetical protein
MQNILPNKEVTFYAKHFYVHSLHMVTEGNIIGALEDDLHPYEDPDDFKCI